mgnify:CR=1 FL=1
MCFVVVIVAVFDCVCVLLLLFICFSVFLLGVGGDFCVFKLCVLHMTGYIRGVHESPNTKLLLYARVVIYIYTDAYTYHTHN